MDDGQCYLCQRWHEDVHSMNSRAAEQAWA